jgi:hypothetical protein
MRAFVTLVLFLFALLASGPLHAQGKKDKEKSPVTARTILADLQMEMKTNLGNEQLKFSEILELVHHELKTNGKEVRFVLDEEAYREEFPDAPAMLDHPLQLRIMPGKASVNHLLRQALKQLPIKSAMIVRAGRVDIVPDVRTERKYLLNQTFHVEFSERRLDQALEELSELTGVSIMIDGRAKEKAQTPVTARFHDDDALQDAVRMLAETADLKLVYLVTGIFVTTPERAKEMQKELKDLYEPKSPPAGFGFPGKGIPGIASTGRCRWTQGSSRCARRWRPRCRRRNGPIACRRRRGDAVFCKKKLA